MSCEFYSNGSSLTVQHTMGTLPANFCPANWQAIFDQIPQSIVSTLQGNYSSFIIGSDTPGADERDKLWFRLDGSDNCRPMGWFIWYNGAWALAVPYGPPPGTIVFSYDAAYASKTDAEMSALIEAIDNYDGGTPFWYLCDGNNGTPDLRGRAPVGAGVTAMPTGLTARYQDVVGGEEEHVLGFNELPQDTFTLKPNVTDFVTRITGSTGNAADVGSANNNDFHFEAFPFVTPSGNAHNNMPPFRALYAMMRSSRLH